MTGTNFTSWYNYSGGTIYVEAATGYFSNSGAVSISDGTNANRIYLFYTTLAVTNFVSVNGVNLQSNAVNLPSATVANTFYKTSFTYSTAGSSVSSAGQTATSYATAISAPAVNQLNLAVALPVGNPLNGHIKKFAYYPTVLTSTQLQSLSAN